MCTIRRKRIVFMSLVAVLMAAGWRTTALGQVARSGWSPPQVLGDGWWQSIAVDRQETAHIGWYCNSGDEKRDALCYSSRGIDGIWTPANDVIYTAESGITVRPILAVTSTGMLYALYRHGYPHYVAYAPVRFAYLASIWSQRVQVSTYGYYGDLMIDRNDTLHVVTSARGPGVDDDVSSVELSPCSLCLDLFYRRSTDGGLTWSTPYAISVEQDSGSDRVEIWEGVSGRIYVDWDEGTDWYIGRGQPRDVRIKYSTDNGLSWSDPIVLDGDNPELRPIQIAATELRDGTLMAVWRYAGDDDSQVYFQLTNDLGQTWSTPSPIPGIYTRGLGDTPLDDYELLTDPLGIVHLFMVGQPELNTGANPGLYHIEYRQDTWGPKQRVFYSPEERPEWPQAAIGPQGDIHLTWFVRGLGEGISSFSSATVGLRVYYSYRGSILANPATQSFDPTRTPQPIPTLLRQLVATVTPLPTVEPLEGPVVERTRDTYAAQAFVGGLLAVAALCAGIFAFARFWRRW